MDRTSDYILYILENDRACGEAMKLISPEIQVQDVQTLRRPLPSWLTGVPTLVKRSTAQAFRGTAALTELEAHKPAVREPTGVGGKARAFDIHTVDKKIGAIGPPVKIERDVGPGGGGESVSKQDIDAALRARGITGN